MADDTERLVIALEARIRDFERNFAKANAAASKNFKAIEDRADASAKRLESSFSKAALGVASSMKTMALGFAGGFAGGIVAGGIDGLVSRLGDVAKSVAAIGDEAKRAGIGVREFQELKFVASQNRIDVDAMVDGLKELSLRADEFVTTGGGSAADAFRRLGYSADELKRKLKNPADLFVEIIGRMHDLKDTAAAVRIADEVFGGTGGERFVELINQGAEGIRATMRQAEELGIVMDEQMIAKAAEVDRMFDAIATTLATKVKGAIVGVVEAWADFLNEYRDYEDQTSDNLTERLGKVIQERNEAERELQALMAEGKTGNPRAGLGMEIEGVAADVKRLADEELRLRSIIAERTHATEQGGDAAKGATPQVQGLANTLSSTGTAANTGAAGLTTFADAIRALQNEIPGLTESLAELDARTKIDNAYRAALGKAQSMGQVYLANQLREQALAETSIKAATRDSAGYLGKFLVNGKNAEHVARMNAEFSKALTEMLASAPESVRAATTITSGFRSFQRQAELFDEAVRKYGSEAAARKHVAPPGKSQHNAGNAADLGFATDEARDWFHQNAGRFGLEFPMSWEPWHVQGAKGGADQRDAAFQAQWNETRQQAQEQATAYRDIVSEAQRYIQTQTAEQQALGMTAQQAAALRYEQQLLAEAQRAGISLTPQQTAELSKLAQGMAEVEAATQQAARSQQDIAAAGQFLGQQIGGLFSGIIDGSLTAEDALKRLVDSLLEATLQAMLLGQGPLAGLFGTAPKAGSAKGIGGIVGAFLGLKRGGIVEAATGGHIRGPGTGTSDSIPARLSNGEFVVNARATAKHRAILEAINSGTIASFASGGLAGAAPLRALNVTTPAGGSKASAAPVTIVSNVTVNASGGTPEQNADLAKQTSASVKDEVRKLVISEMINQKRPGGVLSR